MSPFTKKKRFCRSFEGTSFFKPRAVPLSDLEINVLALDELEAIHLCDYEELNQAQAAEKMKISTGTIQRLLYSGRKKIIDAIYSSKAIEIKRHEHISERPAMSKGRGRRGRRCDIK